jgi:hypothetical protein
MYSINLFFLLCFVAHGLCDFIPLFKTFNKNALMNYIFNIFAFCYIHLINPSISTLIFIIISSLHFNEDFFPYNTIKFPNTGLYILSAPIIIDYSIYIKYLDYIGVDYPIFLISLMYFGGILGIINSQNINDDFYHIVIYTLLCISFGINALYFYMIYYHLGISLCLLCNSYEIRSILIFQGIGLVIMSSIYFLLFDIIIEMFLLYKDYFIGTLFGLLNSHSLTTIAWRQKMDF